MCWAESASPTLSIFSIVQRSTDHLTESCFIRESVCWNKSDEKSPAREDLNKITDTNKKTSAH